jgi:hypothetical protein
LKTIGLVKCMPQKRTLRNTFLNTEQKNKPSWAST